MFDIISIGSATLDLFLKSSRFPLERRNIGAKIEIDELLMAAGGGGTNTAAGLARLGLSTACIARLGKDLFGQFVLQELAKESFDKRYLIEKPTDSTDYSTILVNPDGSRTILVYRGQTRIDETVFPWAALAETKWLYLASMEGNVDLLVKVVGQAIAAGVKVVLNPGHRELQQRERLAAVFPQIEALVLNREEAEVFGLKEAAGQGPKILVVTNGRQGVKLYTDEVAYYAEALMTTPVDETGAGDAFSAGFVAGLVKGWPLDKALKLGVANGAAVVGRFGGKSGLICEKDIDEWMGKRLKIEQIISSVNQASGQP